MRVELPAESLCYYSVLGVQNWIMEDSGLKISKSSVCSVRDKCGAREIKPGAGKRIPKVKTKKEKAVLEAFKALGIV